MREGSEMMGNWRSTLESSLMLFGERVSYGARHGGVEHSLGDPLVVRLELVAGETDGLDSTLSELGLELGDLSELGGADGSEVAVVG